MMRGSLTVVKVGVSVAEAARMAIAEGCSPQPLPATSQAKLGFIEREDEWFGTE